MQNEYSVLDKGFLRLVDHMGNDASIVQAARVSYGGGTKSPEEDRNLVRYLMRHAHWTPFEMVTFKFHVKAPLFVVQQWLRHRTASINQLSYRYTEVKEEFYEPQVHEIRAQSTTNKQGSDADISEIAAIEARAIMVAHNADALLSYKKLIHAGVAREQARMVLPASVYTEFYWQCNLRNIFNFLKLRMDAHAQQEIRAYAYTMALIIADVVPWAYAAWQEYELLATRLSQPFSDAVLEHLRDARIPRPVGVSDREWADFNRWVQYDE